MATDPPGRARTGYSNPCVVCGAPPFTRCVVPRTGRKTDTHMRRVRGEWPEPSPKDGQGAADSPARPSTPSAPERAE